LSRGLGFVYKRPGVERRRHKKPHGRSTRRIWMSTESAAIR
jgi:hypothetical protein